MEKNRVEAFSDGVFAIVITLLILEIKIPHIPEGELKSALIDLLPEFFVYMLSFIIIGVYWVSHHNMFYFLQKVDRNALWLNLITLMFIGILPFPTSLLGNYPGSNLTILLYGVNLIMVNLTGAIFWIYTNKSGLTVTNLSQEFARKVTILHSSPILFYALAILLGLITPSISYIIFAFVPLFFILPNPFLKNILSKPYNE